MEYKTSIRYRKKKLKQLLQCINKYENEIVSALYDDFKKPEFEAIVTETSFVISDLKHTLKNINKWSRPKRVFPSLLNFPSSDYIINEPYGKVLIIAPWNYPFQLAFCPLIAAVAAGNQVVLKPSELTPNTSKIISKIVAEVFDTNHVEVREGGIEIAQQLLHQRWDYIFFTGSVAVGKIVAKAAAEFMTPVTLELGGKNPCIISADCNVKLTAKRIIWGKFLNAGQTCIAPDYLLVDSKIKPKIVAALIDEIQLAYGENPELSGDFPRIINNKNWLRLVELLKNETILYGGQTNENDNYIAPTLLDEPKLESGVMKEEIFGPILPILSYDNEQEIESIISHYEKPLSLYVFSNNTAWTKKIMNTYSFGGGCINDTVIHFSNKRLPFGGVGNSGIGAYHGQLSFDTFSHRKSIVKKANWLDLPFRYAPYKNKINLLKKLLNWF
ncbi:aldehyde dehydrogenase [Flavobacterium sp.]|uniref:aldehyde dehydrogenase n=1 Tax=Flavobacterium sp. TaxID=239 RepID=UPI002B4AD105|nr:aldehyde dehydrogenase [Flavobacterium sp.]HLP64644.1 aldehyde dehydrogenase [Flavobacterium sp.]